MFNVAIWAALGLTVIAVTAAAAMAGIGGFRLWRQLKATRRAVFGELDRLALAAERTADRAARLGDDPRLARALGRLRVSQARLNVLRQALADVRNSVGAVTAWYPRK